MDALSPVKGADNETRAFNDYAMLTQIVERLHRRHLDVIRRVLDEASVTDLTPVQARLLTKIQDRSVSARDLVEHGFHLGPNVAHNLRQLAAHGYLEQERYAQDRRVHRVRRTDKGRAVCERIAVAEAQHSDALAREASAGAGIAGALILLERLERIWGDQLSRTVNGSGVIHELLRPPDE